MQAWLISFYVHISAFQTSSPCVPHLLCYPVQMGKCLLLRPSEGSGKVKCFNSPPLRMQLSRAPFTCKGQKVNFIAAFLPLKCFCLVVQSMTASRAVIFGGAEICKMSIKFRCKFCFRCRTSKNVFSVMLLKIQARHFSRAGSSKFYEWFAWTGEVERGNFSAP